MWKRLALGMMLGAFMGCDLFGPDEPEYATCSYCRGSGRVTCQACDGKGTLEKKISYEVVDAWASVSGILSTTQSCYVQIGNTDTRSGTFTVKFTLKDTQKSTKEHTQFLAAGQPAQRFYASFGVPWLSDGYGWSYTITPGTYRETCSRCSGRGSVTCPVCYGTGRIRE